MENRCIFARKIMNMTRTAQILIVILVFALTVPAQNPQTPKSVKPAEGIRWMTFTEAYKVNKKKPRKIFVDVYTDWCGWCKKMDATTFSNPEIIRYMNEQFYCVKLNAEMKDTLVIDGVTFTNPNPSGRSTHQLAVELLRGKMSYPSYVFLNEASQHLTVIPGYHPATEFEPMLHYFGEDAYKGTTSWEEYKSTFKGKVTP